MAILVAQPVPDPEPEVEVDLRVPPAKAAYNLRSRKNVVEIKIPSSFMR